MNFKQFTSRFLINSIAFLSLLALLQSCATLINQSPDDMDASNEPAGYSQPAPQHAESSDENSGETDFHARIARAIRQEDILVGMSPENVLASWGRPREVQVAGNGSSGNERWLYYTANSLQYYGIGKVKTIYFEDGRVVGWQTRDAQ